MVQVLRKIGFALPHVVVGVSGLLFVGFSLGCMNLSFGGKTQVVSPTSQETPGDGLQRGKVYVPQGQEVCVYYPVPYLSPPNLEFEDSDNKRHLQIVDQKPDHVRVKNTNSWPVEVPWKARGMMVTSAKTSDTSSSVQASVPSAQDQQKVTVQPRLP